MSCCVTIASCEPALGQGESGGSGPPGPPGAAATIAVGTVTTVAPGDPATVTNVGTPNAAIFDFEIPQGDDGTPGAPGAPGAAATIAVGTVTTVAPGDPATVTNVGTANAAIFDFEIPQGDDGTPGAPGAPGAAATIAVGTVTTLAAGSPATVTNVGTANAAIFDFGIPQGASGVGITLSEKGSNQSGITSTPTNVTGLSYLFPGAGRYGFEIFGTFQSTNQNTSAVFDFVGLSATYFRTIVIINHAISQTTNSPPNPDVGGGILPSDDIGTNNNVALANTAYVFWIRGIIRTNTSDTLQLRCAASNAGGPTIQINTNSTLQTWLIQ